MTSVAVGVATYLRPEGLARALAGIAQLRIDVGDISVRVIVVDNDPGGSARDLVQGVAGGFPWPLEYIAEPRKGISAARNAALTCAANADFVAFLDDDEVPDESWLMELLAVQRRTGSDVTMGPVIPRYEASPPRWVVRSGVFEPVRYPTGHRLHYGTTANVLLTAGGFPSGLPRFAEEFGLSGGEDTHYFMKAHLAGHSIVWADAAEVVEWVPPARTTLRWVLARQYRRGNTLSLCLLDLEDSLPRRLKRVAAGMVNIAGGAGLAVGAALLRPPVAVRGLQRLSFGLGLLAGLAGVRYEAYGRRPST